MFSTTFALGFIASLSGLSSAHMMIASPVPYGQSSLDNSPLLPDRSNYPCKLRSGGYAITTENHMTAGDEQTLSFKGSASHGGGTCLLSLSKSRTPTATDNWKIFQAYIGGCPVSGTGNDGTNNFTYAIPKEMSNGEYSFSWTWYNRIGNREIYQNCAPITVSGGADNDDFFNALPNMFTINLPPSDCTSVESSNLDVPNLNDKVVVKKDTTYSAVAASGPKCAASAAAMTQGVAAGSDSSPAASATSAPSSASASSSSAAATSAPASYASSAPSSTASPSSGDGMIGMNTSSAAPSVATAPASSAASPSAYSTMSSAAAPAPSSYTPASGTNSTSGGSSPSSSSSSDSAMTCSSDGQQFCVTANGQNVCRQVATGTSCSNGQIVKRTVFRHPHIRRHF